MVLIALCYRVIGVATAEKGGFGFFGLQVQWWVLYLQLGHASELGMITELQMLTED